MSEGKKPDDLPSDLSDLAGIAAAQDAAIDGAALVVPGAPPVDAAPAVDRAAELGAMLGLGVAMVAPALPFLPSCYTPEVCAQIGAALDAVAEKHGWNLEGLQSPELALAAVSIPPTVAAVMLGRQHFAAKREAARLADKARSQSVDAPKVLQPGANAGGHAGHVLQPGAVG